MVSLSSYDVSQGTSLVVENLVILESSTLRSALTEDKDNGGTHQRTRPLFSYHVDQGGSVSLDQHPGKGNGIAAGYFVETAMNPISALSAPWCMFGVRRSTWY
jgi:hypothetical protein